MNDPKYLEAHTNTLVHQREQAYNMVAHLNALLLLKDQEIENLKKMISDMTKPTTSE